MFVGFAMAQNQDAYKGIYEADKDGKTIQGGREILIRHIHNGNPICVGWIITRITQYTKKA